MANVGKITSGTLGGGLILFIALGVWGYAEQNQPNTGANTNVRLEGYAPIIDTFGNQGGYQELPTPTTTQSYTATEQKNQRGSTSRQTHNQVQVCDAANFAPGELCYNADGNIMRWTGVQWEFTGEKWNFATPPSLRYLELLREELKYTKLGTEVDALSDEELTLALPFIYEVLYQQQLELEKQPPVTGFENFSAVDPQPNTINLDIYPKWKDTDS